MTKNEGCTDFLKEVLFIRLRDLLFKKVSFYLNINSCSYV